MTAAPLPCGPFQRSFSYHLGAHQGLTHGPGPAPCEGAYILRCALPCLAAWIFTGPATCDSDGCSPDLRLKLSRALRTPAGLGGFRPCVPALRAGPANLPARYVTHKGDVQPDQENARAYAVSMYEPTKLYPCRSGPRIGTRTVSPGETGHRSPSQRMRSLPALQGPPSEKRTCVLVPCPGHAGRSQLARQDRARCTHAGLQESTAGTGPCERTGPRAMPAEWLSGPYRGRSTVSHSAGTGCRPIEYLFV